MVVACRQRRILQIVALIGVACVVFLCFQVFLIGFLDRDAHLGLQHGVRAKNGLDHHELRVADLPDARRRTSQRLVQLQHGLKYGCSSDNCSVAKDLRHRTVHAVSQSRAMMDKNGLSRRSFTEESHGESRVKLSQFESVWEFLEQRLRRPVISVRNVTASHSTRGVYLRWQRLYEPDSHYQFSCILSQVVLHVITLV